jgi:hypothetical protein
VNVSFFKLHVAGDDFILVDRSRRGHEELLARPELLPALAAAMSDRRRGVGGRGVVFLGRSGPLDVRFFGPDGRESPPSGDALLCAARWAFDSGSASGGRVRIATPSGEQVLSALDSRSFAVELPAPDLEAASRMELLLDGLSEVAYAFDWDGRWAASLGGRNAPSPARVRTALASAMPDATPVVARPAGRELMRFSTLVGADRVCAAAMAVAAGIAAGKTEPAAVAEWRGKGAAVAFADFGPPKSAGGKAAAAGPGALIDRGRFYVDWKRPGRVLVAGIAEYAFEGSYDYFE